MTRDLPFSDDDAADDNGGDAAYRIATGVARVARAGAYVTGGALVAASGNRGSNAAITHDSKSVGWSQVNDPQPNVPSPTVTFPDLTPDSVPAQHLGPATAAPVSTPFGPLDDYHHGTDAGLFPASFDPTRPDVSINGFHGLGLPDNESGVPGSAVPHWGVPLENPATDVMATPSQPHVPGLDPLQPNFLQSLPGFAMPGVPGMHLPGTDGAHLPDMAGATGPFDGVGASDGQGVGAFLGTHWTVDAHVGADGVWFHSDLKVDLGVGHVMDQYNQFTQQASQGLSHPGGANLTNAAPAAGTGHPTGTPASATPAASNSVPGQATSPITGTPGLPGQSASGLPGQGTAGAPAGVGPTSVVPGASSPGAVPGVSGPVAAQPGPASLGGTPFAVPSAPSAPVAFTPVATPAAAPVVPAAVAPVAVAPVAVAQPVAVTPLQTTIQPDAANQPIANLLSTHGGPSPLTAPAAVAPALFDHAKLPVLATGEPSAPGHPVTLTDKPVSPGVVPTPAPHVSTPAKIDPLPVLTPAPTVPTAKIPTIDPDITKPGGTPAITPAPTVPTTKLPDPDATKPGVDTPTVPTDVTVPSHQPTATVPVHPTPEVPVPTIAPTPEVPTHQPTVSVAPAPTVAPVPTVQQPITTPPHVEVPQQPVKPIADHYDSGDHLLGYHDAGLLAHDGGLFTPLLPDATVADDHSTVLGPGDHHMLLL